MNYALLFSISIIWGGQFVLITNALISYTPEQVAFLRTIFAAVFLVVTCKLFKYSSLKRTFESWKKVVLISVFEIVIPFTAITWGQKFLASSMVAMIIGSIPIFTLILVIITKIEEVNREKILGIVVGFIGLTTLLMKGIPGEESSFLAKAAVLTGSLSFALALIIIKQTKEANPVVLSRDTFVVGSIILFTVLYFKDPSFIYLPLNYHSLLSTFILGTVCSGLVYIMYVLLIKGAGASFCSLSNYLVPIFGMFFGLLFMDETLDMQTLLGSAIIISSLCVGKVTKLVTKGISKCFRAKVR